MQCLSYKQFYKLRFPVQSKTNKGAILTLAYVVPFCFDELLLGLSCSAYEIANKVIERSSFKAVQLLALSFNSLLHAGGFLEGSSW